MREIDFPTEWVTGDLVDKQAFRVEGLLLFGVLLDDGANLWTLVYEGGVRFARTDGTSLVLRTREAGAPLAAERDRVDRVWADLLSVDRRSALEVEAELRRN